jgi:hypothetical protein
MISFASSSECWLVHLISSCFLIVEIPLHAFHAYCDAHEAHMLGVFG